VERFSSRVERDDPRAPERELIRGVRGLEVRILLAQKRQAAILIGFMGSLKKRRKAKINKHKRRKKLRAHRHKKRTWQK
jgi:hypothetical protein